MGKLFDFDSFDLEDVLKQPLDVFEADYEAVGDLFTDPKSAFGEHQDKMTEIQGSMGMNKSNKLVKNSDAIAGAIVGAIYAAPAIAGAMGSGAGGAAGGTAAGTGTAGTSGGVLGTSGGAVGGTTAGATGTSAGAAGGATGGTTAGTTGSFWSNPQNYARLAQMQQKQQPQQQQAPQQSMLARLAPAKAPTSGGQLGRGMSYDEIMNLYRG